MEVLNLNGAALWSKCRVRVFLIHVWDGETLERRSATKSKISRADFCPTLILYRVASRLSSRTLLLRRLHGPSHRTFHLRRTCPPAQFCLTVLRVAQSCRNYSIVFGTTHRWKTITAEFSPRPSAMTDSVLGAAAHGEPEGIISEPYRTPE